MIATLLAIGAKLLARPAVLIGIVGALAFGIREFVHWREVRSLTAENAREVAVRQQETHAKLEALAALANVQRDNTALRSKFDEQNLAIENLQRARTAEQRAAALEAVRALQRGREEAEALRQPTTTVRPGNAAMNEWLRERFGGVK